MRALRTGVVLGCLALSSVLLAQSSLSPEAQLKAAMNRETVDRDFAGAIEQYRQIAATFEANHVVASKALLQLGGLQERMGKLEARTTYQRIVTEYADTGATAAAARARLTEIQDAAEGPFKSRSLDAWVKDAGVVTPSPNGRYLAYSRTRPPVSATTSTEPAIAMYARDLSSGRERVIVDAKQGEFVMGPVTWSPDSQRVAVMFHTPGSTDFRIVTIATGDFRSIWRGQPRADAAFKWSPDSRSLAFVVKPSQDDTYEHHALSVASGAESVVVDTLHGAVSAVTWSPDSRRLAYVESGPSANTIRIKTPGIEAAQAIELPKEKPTTRVTLHLWLAAGELEYAQTVDGGNDHYLVNVSGGTPRKICEGRGASGGNGCQSLDPTGTLIITRKNVSEGGRVVLRNVRDGSEHPLTTQSTFENTALGFSPDGRLFGFKSNRDGGSGFYVVPTDALPVAAPIKVASLESDGSGISGTWTPSGLIVRISNNQTNQYRVDLDPRTGKAVGAPIRLTEDSPVNIGNSISPDSRRIAYISRGRPSGIAIMDANGAHERVIKEVPPDMLLRMAILGWLSDSELLIWDAKLGTGDLRQAPKYLMRMNAMTGEMREAGPAIDGHALRLTGDNSVFYADAKDDFFTRPVAGGPARALNVADWSSQAVSGQWLAYSTTDDSGGKGKPMPGDIRVRSIVTGAERIAVKFADTDTDSQAPLDISRDGKFLLYADPYGKIMLANVETGESWPLLRNPPSGVDFDWPNAAHFSPDGTYVVSDGFISRTTWRAYDGVTYNGVTKLIGGKKK